VGGVTHQASRPLKDEQIGSINDLASSAGMLANADTSPGLAYARRMGLEGIVSKRVDSGYHSGPSRTWFKSRTLRARPRCGDARRSDARIAAHAVACDLLVLAAAFTTRKLG
jgi:hypothetical protein